MRIINGQKVLSDIVAVDTTDFDGALSSTDNTAQKAFDTLDDTVGDAGDDIDTLEASKLDDVVDDTTPQLGGTLDSQNKDIDNSKTITFNTEYDNGTKSGNFTINLNNGQKQKVVLNNTGMVITLTAPPGPGHFQLRLIQDGSVGSRTVTWPGTVKWTNQTVPTLATAVDAYDIISLFYDGTNYSGVMSPNFG